MILKQKAYLRPAHASRRRRAGLVLQRLSGGRPEPGRPARPAPDRGCELPALLDRQRRRVTADAALLQRASGAARGGPDPRRRGRLRAARAAARRRGASASTPSSGTSTASGRRRSGPRSACAARASSSPTSTPACSSTTRRWSASTAATWAAALRPQLQLVRPVRRLRRPPAPCDNNGHGTHTMGTMVGDDGGRPTRSASRRAPSGSPPRAARPAAARTPRCCVRPVDARADRPQRRTTRGPTCGPHIVNNSWGGGGGDPFYQATVQAWVAAGIFPGSPTATAARLQHRRLARRLPRDATRVGAFDINDVIASFSSRGPRPATARSSRTSPRPA